MMRDDQDLKRKAWLCVFVGCVLVDSRCNSLVGSFRIGREIMGKAQEESKGKPRRTSKASIPPSWQLNDAQRSFIEDLWQDDAPQIKSSGTSRHRDRQ
jgi:hypothetical protein